ncbi:MAG TPA: hypothetical protein VGZ25_00410, partial [Gemmataceae bacterium]|nr:hypothetical protein [Gemmataceae bacterium]
DGRPATKKQAHARMARMIGGDQETTPLEKTIHLAQRVALRQQYLFEVAIESVASEMPNPPRCVLLAGSGEILAAPLVAESGLLGKVEAKRLSRVLNPTASHAACAYALAVLASEQIK